MIKLEIELEIDPILLNLDDWFSVEYSRILADELEKFKIQVVQASYIGTTGSLARGWKFSVDGFEGSVFNESPVSLFQMVGRGPGKQPPVAAIAPWARSKGFNPYAVARKIGETGTERWRLRENFLGLGLRGGIKSGSVILEVPKRIVVRSKDLKI